MPLNASHNPYAVQVAERGLLRVLNVRAQPPLGSSLIAELRGHRETSREPGQKHQNKTKQGFPGGAVVKNPPANAWDTGSSPGPGRSHVPWSN